MIKISRKNTIPAILLIAVVIALAIVTGYALSLKSRVDGTYTQIAVATKSPADKAIPLAAATATPSPAPTVEPIPADNELDAELADVESPYWSDGVLFVNDTYRSPGISVTVRTVEDSKIFRKSLVYYVADIRVSDVTQIRTGCNSGNFSRAGRGPIEETAARENALVAISGDFVPALVIRNGELYQKKIYSNDICLLLKSGEMEIVKGTSASLSKIMEKDPWQAWQFGPALFNSKGNPISNFPGVTITPANPRSCIGYYEPGHYCFVVVDGRQTKSRGVTLSELARLMQSLGCKQAYNLDGGASAHFYYNNDVLNEPSGGGRDIADIVYVAYEPYQESGFYCGKAGLSK